MIWKIAVLGVVSASTIFAQEAKQPRLPGRDRSVCLGWFYEFQHGRVLTKGAWTKVRNTCDGEASQAKEMLVRASSVEMDQRRTWLGDIQVAVRKCRVWKSEWPKASTFCDDLLALPPISLPASAKK